LPSSGNQHTPPGEFEQTQKAASRNWGLLAFFEQPPFSSSRFLGLLENFEYVKEPWRMLKVVFHKRATPPKNTPLNKTTHIQSIYCFHDLISNRVLLFTIK